MLYSSLWLVDNLIAKYRYYVDDAWAATAVMRYPRSGCFSYKMGNSVIFFPKNTWDSFSLLEQFVFTFFLQIYRVYTYVSLLSRWETVFALHFVTILGFLLLVLISLLLVVLWSVQKNKPLYEVSESLVGRTLELVWVVYSPFAVSLGFFSCYLWEKLVKLLTKVPGPRVACLDYYDYLCIVPYCSFSLCCFIALLSAAQKHKLEVTAEILSFRLVHSKAFLDFLWLLLVLFTLFFFFIIIPILIAISVGPI